MGTHYIGIKTQTTLRHFQKCDHNNGILSSSEMHISFKISKRDLHWKFVSWSSLSCIIDLVPVTYISMWSHLCLIQLMSEPSVTLGPPGIYMFWYALGLFLGLKTM